MEITTSTHDDIFILRVEGDLKTPDSNEIYDIVKKKVELGQKKILIDLGGVKFMNSIGIGVLIRAYTTTKTNGGQLKLAAIDEKVKGVLTVTNLHSVFEEYDSVEKALADFE